MIASCWIYVIRDGRPERCGKPAAGWYESDLQRTRACAEHRNDTRPLEAVTEGRWAGRKPDPETAKKDRRIYLQRRPTP